MEKRRKLLGEILVEQGVVSVEQVLEGRHRQMACGGLIGERLVDLGHATADAVRHALAAQQGLDPNLSLDGGRP